MDKDILECILKSYTNILKKLENLEKEIQKKGSNNSEKIKKRTTKTAPKNSRPKVIKDKLEPKTIPDEKNTKKVTIRRINKKDNNSCIDENTKNVQKIKVSENLVNNDAETKLNLKNLSKPMNRKLIYPTPETNIMKILEDELSDECS